MVTTIRILGKAQRGDATAPQPGRHLLIADLFVTNDSFAPENHHLIGVATEGFVGRGYGGLT